MKRLLSILVCLTGFHLPAVADTTLSSEVSEALSEFRGGPAISLIVSLKGKTLHHTTEGLASLELQQEASNDMVWAIGSISKQFTAVAILLLEEQGKLRTSMSVADFIDNVPPQITIQHLLTHTSGLSDVLRSRELINVYVTPFSNEERLEYVVRTMETKAQPGLSYDYSNTNYILLAHIVEKASGETFENFLDTRIFKPLNMHQTFVGSPSKVQMGKVNGYNPNQQGGLAPAYYLPFDLLWSKGAGNLYSNTADLIIWIRALNSGSLLSETSLLKLRTGYQLEDGTLSANGYGFHLEKMGSHEALTKSGMINGFQSNLIWVPEQDLIIVGLSARLDKSPQFIYEIAGSILEN